MEGCRGHEGDFEPDFLLNAEPVEILKGGCYDLWLSEQTNVQSFCLAVSESENWRRSEHVLSFFSHRPQLVETLAVMLFTCPDRYDGKHRGFM